MSKPKFWWAFWKWRWKWGHGHILVGCFTNGPNDEYVYWKKLF